MMPGGRRASAPATAGRRPESTALLPPAVPPRRASARLGRGGARPGPPAEALVRRSVVEPLVSCGICGGLLRDATAFSECLDAFCRECIYDKFAKENIKCCPTCGVNLGCTPLEKLRSLIFSTKTKRRKVVTTKSKKRNGMISTESILSSVVDIVAEGSTAPQPPAASQSEAQNMEVEVIDEPDEALIVQESVFEPSFLNLAPVGRDALSRIRCRDFYSVCHLSAETGALIVWQPPLVLEEMVSYDHLAPRQDPESFGPPATSDTKYQRQAPAVEMTLHPRMTVQDDENLRGDILALFNESNARIMGRYDAYISQLKAENSRLKKDLENERAAALERTRILEEGHRRELEKERAAAAERTRIVEERLQRELEDEREAVIMSMRILEERLQRESQSAKSTRRQNQSLEAEIARLYEELENGRADNQALMSDILEKSDELATLKYHADMFESDNTDLEDQVEHLKKELEYAKKEHARYVRQVLDAARAIPNDLETGTSDLA